MTTGRGIAVAGALVAAAILARAGWTQATTAPVTLGYVVTSCGTPPSIPAATGWAYSNGSVAPITIKAATGQVCVDTATP